MKQAVKAYVSPLKNEMYLSFIKQIIFVLLGFISSRGSIIGEFSPFGTSLVAGVTKPYILSSAIGSIIGYIFPSSGFSGFKYISAVFAVALVRYITSGFSKIDKNSLISALIAFLAVFTTGIAIIIDNLDLSIKVASEALLSASAAFFINKAIQIKPYKKPGLLAEELVAVCFTISILILGLIPIEIDGVSFGRIIAITIILTAAKFGGAATGALSGVLFSFVSAISLKNYSTTFPFFAAGGLFAGFFSSLGKIGTSIGFFAVAFIASVFSNDMPKAAVTVIECLISSGLFMLLPKKLLVLLGNLFLGKPEILTASGIKGALIMRLQFASEALKNVSSTVKEVSQELSRINSPSFEDVLKRDEYAACKGCSLSVHCWETHKSETVEAVMGISKAIKQPETNVKENVPENFLGRCIRFTRFAEAVNTNYSDYLAKITAESRVEEIRGVVEEHFNGISNMLNDLAGEFKYEQKLDEKATANVITTLRNMNINVIDCAASIDKYERLSVDCKVKLQKDTILNKKDIMKKLSIVCDRDFDVPCITKTEKEAFISITEKAIFYVDMGISQHSANENSMCGDSYEYFTDGKGRLIMLLSDGMGVGGRAAVDSAMVTGLMSRLIKSGFGYDCSLKIANSSMLFKSTDESLATVDISVIDLFTGVTELYKAGAAPTIIRRKGRTAKASSTSLPAGILKDIGFDRAELSIKNNDIILMMSDGVVNEGTDWICQELENFDGTAQELADKIALSARRRRTDNHEDDITVMAAILKKVD